jgi:hypothetical protein
MTAVTKCKGNLSLFMLADLPTRRKEMKLGFARHERKKENFIYFSAFLELANYKAPLPLNFFFSWKQKRLPHKVLNFHIWACIQENFTTAFSVSLLFPKKSLVNGNI